MCVHLDEILDVALTNDGHRAVSASADHTLKLWDAETGTTLAAFTCDASATSCVFVNEDTILAGDAGGHLHFLRLEEPKAKS
jgi:WD40 repeat protein